MKLTRLPLLLVLVFLPFMQLFAEQLPPPRKVIIGGDLGYPPFEFINDKGQPDGFNIDLAEALMQELGWEWEVRLMPWTKAMEELAAQRLDFVPGMALSPERRQRYLFTTPHSFLFQNLVCRKDSPINAADDLRGKRVIVQSDDIAATLLNQLGLAETAIFVESLASGLQLLSTGNYDAMICGDVLAKYLIRTHGFKNLEVRYLGVVDPVGYCVATYAGNTELKMQLNAALEQLRINGTYTRIYSKWFTPDGPHGILRYAYPIISILLGVLLLSGVVILLIRRHIRQVNHQLYEANAALREKNIYLDLALQAGSIIPAILDVKSGHVQITLPENSDIPLYFIKEAQFSFTEMLQLVHPDDRQLFCDFIEQAKLSKGRSEVEIRYKNTEREECYAVHCVGLDLDAQGHPQKLVGYFQHITERKQAELELIRQREFFANLLDFMPVPVHIKTLGEGTYGKYIYWNKESERLFGEGLFKSTTDIVSDERAHEIMAIDRRVLETGEPYTCHEQIRTNSGQVYDTFVLKNRVRVEEQDCVLIVRWDIGEKRALNQKQKILDLSIRALNAYTWYWDQRTGELTFGEGFEQTGGSPQQMNSITRFAERIHPDQREQFLAYMDAFSAQEEGDFSVVYQIDMAANGNYEWWECRGRMEQEQSNGTPYKYIYGMDINIDSHKKTEQAVLESRQELHELIEQNELIINNISSGLVFIDRNYQVQWENLSTSRFAHPMKGSYQKGHTCYEGVMGCKAPCETCVVRQSWQSLDTAYDEWQIGDATVELVASPVLDENREVIGSVLRINDITEKKKITQELEQSKNHAEESSMLLRNIFEMLPGMLFVKDASDDYRFVVVNSFLCNVIGRPADEIVGKTDFEIFPQAEAELFRREDEKAVNGNAMHVYEEETWWLGRHIVWQTTKTVITAVNGHKLLIGLSIDLTEKIEAYKELEKAKLKAEESNKLKSAFLANMSHEIRTPLNAIVGFSNIITSTEEQEERELYCNLINTNNELLLRLIGDVLDLSKIEAGMLVFHPEPFDVSALFKELAPTFRRGIKSSDVALRCELPEEVLNFEFDRSRFTQVITNFATNAVKFTTKGHITMGYELVDGGIRVFVSDTGIGIAPDKVQKVFDRFEKLDDFAQGTGLGMAICKAIMDACGGRIGVDSKPDVGSTFWAWFPYKSL